MKYGLNSLRTRIISIVICFTAIIAVFVSIISYSLTMRYLKESQQQSTYINLQLIGGEINSNLNAALAFSNWLLLDSDTENYLANIEGFTDTDVTEYRRFSMETWNQLNDEFRLSSAHDLITRFIVSVPDGSHFLHITRIPGSSTLNISDSVMTLECFDRLMDSDNYVFTGLIPSPVMHSDTPDTLPIIRPVKSSKSPVTIGWIYVELSSELITKHISNMILNEDSDIYITFDDDLSYKYENGIYTEASLPDGLVTYKLPDKSISVSMLPSAAELRRRSRDQALLFLMVILFLILFGIILYTMLFRMVNVPIDALLSKMTKVAQGDFSRDNNIEWNNELGEIGKGINDLSDSVDGLINSRIEDERTRQALEYRILQSQINPHFMYNTLNTIKWMATIQGADGIADISTALSRLLKNISKVEDNLIPLRNEIGLLNDYYTIMKYRYGGTIDLEYDIADDSLLDCMVNRFSLQPIVENSIFHGIEPKGSAGHINIRISEEDDDLLIDITDNGVGMDEETLKSLISNDKASPNDFFKDVGISNVADRIRFTFGDRYGLSAESTQGEYTTIHIRLPKTYHQKEQAKNDQ